MQASRLQHVVDVEFPQLLLREPVIDSHPGRVVGKRERDLADLHVRQREVRNLDPVQANGEDDRQGQRELEHRDAAAIPAQMPHGLGARHQEHTGADAVAVPVCVWYGWFLRSVLATIVCVVGQPNSPETGKTRM